MNSKHKISSSHPSVAGKRETILRTATHVFATNGYFNSKVADIAREAGVADGTVYLYFKSKEEILHSIFERTIEEAIAEGRKQLADISDPREKLRNIAQLHLERMGADRDLAVVFQVDMRGSARFLEEFSATGLAEYLGLIREIIEEGQRSGLFREDLNSMLVAKVLFGALDEMVTNWVLSKRRYELAPVAAQVLDILLDGVRRVIVPGTLQASAPTPEVGSLSQEYSSTRKVARALILVDHALETLLMLVDEGPLTVKRLVKELVPEEDIITVISELRRCELVEISNNLISPTREATRIAETLRTKLESNRHETS